jgi:hypothetical protein
MLGADGIRGRERRDRTGDTRDAGPSTPGQRESLDRAIEQRFGLSRPAERRAP